MSGFRGYVVGLADSELAAVGGSSGFDRQCAFEHEIPIGHGAVKVPGDLLAQRQGKDARLHVAADRHRLFVSRTFTCATSRPMRAASRRARGTSSARAAATR